jgi:hypothetical protein
VEYRDKGPHPAIRAGGDEPRLFWAEDTAANRQDLQDAQQAVINFDQESNDYGKVVATAPFPASDATELGGRHVHA